MVKTLVSSNHMKFLNLQVQKQLKSSKVFSPGKSHTLCFEDILKECYPREHSNEHRNLSKIVVTHPLRMSRKGASNFFAWGWSTRGNASALPALA